ncbi:MAG: hypothetical protein HUJ26_15095 [Planctomycetaceae bacterium]|nr:hypothetical protein [Planctomycetaceae bacterium]
MATQQKTPPPNVKPPELKVTRFDLTTAGVIAGSLALAGFLLWLTAVWVTNRPPESESFVPVEIIDLAGGVEDGAPDESLMVESPEDVTDDPSLAEIESEETEVAEMIDNVLELAETANNQAQEQYETDLRNAGKAGSATGTGKNPLGFGEGEGGLPREQRWFITFREGATLTEYAQQLEQFKIQLGALLPSGKLIYLSNITAPRPTTQEITDGSQEKRLYMTWQGGQLRGADRNLFAKAGIDVTGGILFHFYDPQTENQLARLEQEKATKDVDEIRRTYFVVRRTGSDYAFSVTRIIYF